MREKEKVERRKREKAFTIIILTIVKMSTET